MKIDTSPIGRRRQKVRRGEKAFNLDWRETTRCVWTRAFGLQSTDSCRLAQAHNVLRVEHGVPGCERAFSHSRQSERTTLTEQRSRMCSQRGGPKCTWIMKTVSSCDFANARGTSLHDGTGPRSRPRQEIEHGNDHRTTYLLLLLPRRAARSLATLLYCIGGQLEAPCPEKRPVSPEELLWQRCRRVA